MDVGHLFLMLSFIKLVLGKREGYIVGGTFVKDIQQFPHVAFLELLSKKAGEGTFTCGASILNQMILITAAHCLDNVGRATAYVGNINRDDGTPYQVENFKQHHNWDPNGVSNDIGLCKLWHPLKFGPAVKRVLLLKNPPRTMTADLTGWGAVEETEYTDTVILKHAVQKLWNHRECKGVIRGLPKGTICGGHTRARTFASRGDSGSALMVENKFMVGLVSFKEVAVSRSLIVYTDVTHFYDWIAKASKRLCFMKLVLGEMEGFIVGGVIVKNIEQFPHVAFLEIQAKKPIDGMFICGASILNQIILITAAHCLDNVKLATAYVGNIDRDEGTPYRVARYEQHHKWNVRGVRNDIGLCRLSKPLEFGLAVKRVLLLRNPPKIRNADLAGWGAVEEIDYTDSTVLKHTVQRLWSHKQCKRVIYDLPQGTICGGRRRGRKNFAAKGDSGSGLLIEHSIIVGLVSYKDVSVSRSLVVYTDTTHHYDWIIGTTKRLSCSKML